MRIPLVLLLLFTPFLQAADAPKTNVLFIMSDDYRVELASDGTRAALTPNLTRLAQRSVQFNRAYCQQAVCNPSRSSMLTGLRPDTLGLYVNSIHFRQLKPDVTTLPLWFKTHGYTTRCVGKIFHNAHTKVQGDPQSWSKPEFLHFATHGADVIPDSIPAPANAATLNDGRKYGGTNLCEALDVPDEAYYDGRVAAEAVRVLEEEKGGPFFLAVGFWKPHAPFNAPKKYWDLYDRAKLPELNPARPEGAPDLAFHPSTEVLGPINKRTPLTAEQIAEMRHGYFANISYLDAQLGKVLDALDQSGVADRTVVVFASDHGFHIGEHGLWAKTSNFEYDAQVPLMIHVPGTAQAGKRTEALAELLDLFPTLVDLCGLPQPPGLEGKSLAPVLKDPAARVKDAAFTQFPRPAYYDREPSKQPNAMGYSARTEKARYTEWRDYQTKEVVARELYEEAQQPAELRNRADDPEMAPLRAELEALLVKQFPRGS